MMRGRAVLREAFVSGRTVGLVNSGNSGIISLPTRCAAHLHLAVVLARSHPSCVMTNSLLSPTRARSRAVFHPPVCFAGVRARRLASIASPPTITTNTTITTRDDAQAEANTDLAADAAKTPPTGSDASTSHTVLGSIQRPQTLRREIERLFSGGRPSSPVITRVFKNIVAVTAPAHERMSLAALVVRHLTRMGTFPGGEHVITLNALLDVYAKNAASMALADELLLKMETHGPQPDVVTYSSVMNGHANTGNASAAMALLRRMQTRGVQPNAHTVGTVLKALCRGRHVAEAVEVYRAALAGGVELDVSVYNSVVSALLGAGRVEDVRLLLSDMADRGIVTDAHTVGALARHAVTVLDVGRRGQLLDQLLSISTPRECVAVYAGVMEACRRAGLNHDAVRLFAKMRSHGMTPTIDMYIGVIRSLVSLGRGDAAWEHLRLLSVDGLQPSCAIYTTLLHLAVPEQRHRPLKWACAKFSLSRASKRNSLTLTATGMDGDAEGGGAAESAATTPSSIVPTADDLTGAPTDDSLHRNALNERLVSRVLAHMDAAGVTPDTPTWLGLLSVCGALQARVLGARIVEDRVVLSTLLVNALLSVAVDYADSSYFHRLRSFMIASKIPDNVGTALLVVRQRCESLDPLGALVAWERARQTYGSVVDVHAGVHAWLLRMYFRMGDEWGFVRTAENLRRTACYPRTSTVRLIENAGESKLPMSVYRETAWLLTVFARHNKPDAGAVRSGSGSSGSDRGTETGVDLLR